MASAKMFQNVGQVCCSMHRALLGASRGESSGFLQNSQVMRGFRRQNHPQTAPKNSQLEAYFGRSKGVNVILK